MDKLSIDRANRKDSVITRDIDLEKLLSESNEAADALEIDQSFISYRPLLGIVLACVGCYFSLMDKTPMGFMLVMIGLFFASYFLYHLLVDSAFGKKTLDGSNIARSTARSKRRS